MLGQTQNPLLQKTEQEIQSKVPPEMQSALQRIVTAGLKVMYSPQTQELLIKQISQQGDAAELAGAGVAKLLGLLFKESKGTMPMKAAIPAATILLCEGLDFMEKAGKIQVNPNTLSQAMQALASNLLQLFGVTPDKLQGALQKAQGSQAAPQQPAQPPAPTGGILSNAAGGQ